MTLIRYSRGKRTTDNKPAQREAKNFDAFAEAFLADRSDAKHKTYVCAPFAMGPHSNPGKHSGDAHWRLKDLVQPRAFLPFDFDGFDAPATAEQLRVLLQRFKGFGYNTASHTAEAPRMRAVLAQSRATSREEGEALCKALQALIEQELGAGRISFDVSVYRAEQPLYTPLHGAEAFAFAGSPVDVDAMLAQATFVDGLDEPRSSSAGERAADIASADPVLAMLNEKGMVKQDLGAGKFAVQCPCGADHTSESGDSSTVYFLPNFGGVKYGKFHCLHAHCVGREQEKFIEALGLNPHDVWAAQRGDEAAVEGDAESKKRDSQSDQIVKFAQARYELLHDDQKNVYAQSKTTGIVCKLTGRAFRDDIYAAYFEAKHKAIKAASFGEALDTLTALGMLGETRSVFLRVASHQGGYFIDLCQPGNSHAVHLSGDGWQVLEKPPVLFVRGEAQQPLPMPVAGGTLAALWEVINVPEDARLLVIAFIIESFRADTPYPGLELLGEQGSGKSLTAKFIRRLIDPNACDLRAAPKAVEDIFVVAAHSHVATFENISHLQGAMQDALCILSTGGGIAKRSLYTDSDESIISVQRPWIVNGISAAVTQQDLVDRTISIDCPVIEARGTSTELHQRFEANQAALLGAILDLAAKALAALPDIHLAPEDRPRLAEYALLGMAIAHAVGYQPAEFMRQFNAARGESIARVLDSSPVATAVVDWLDEEPQGMTDAVKHIMQRLEAYRPVGSDAWPKSAKGLGDALRRAAPALRQLGIECRCLGKIGGAVKWSISKKVSGPSSKGEQDIRTSRTCSPELSAERIGTF